jgi:hypothetical protein
MMLSGLDDRHDRKRSAFRANWLPHLLQASSYDADRSDFSQLYESGSHCEGRTHIVYSQNEDLLFARLRIENTYKEMSVLESGILHPGVLFLSVPLLAVLRAVRWRLNPWNVVRSYAGFPAASGVE